MREIKFRSWVEGRGMDYCEAHRSLGAFMDFQEVHYGIGGFTLMQYTGLKDKNGTEIYEGDIINICSKGRCNPAKVIFDNEDQKGCFCVIGYLGDLRTYPIKDFVDCEIEVIGNIHENPDLIEWGQTDG